MDLPDFKNFGTLIGSGSAPFMDRKKTKGRKCCHIKNGPFGGEEGENRSLLLQNLF